MGTREELALLLKENLILSEKGTSTDHLSDDEKSKMNVKLAKHYASVCDYHEYVVGYTRKGQPYDEETYQQKQRQCDDGVAGFKRVLHDVKTRVWCI